MTTENSYITVSELQREIKAAEKVISAELSRIIKLAPLTSMKVAVTIKTHSDHTGAQRTLVITAVKIDVEI